MTGTRRTLPWTIAAAAVAAIVIALLDATDTILAAVSPAGTGRIGGTLARDALLLVGGVFLLRRASWAQWFLAVLFALALLRATVADEWIEWAGVSFALGGLIALFLPPSRAWLARPRASELAETSEGRG